MLDRDADGSAMKKGAPRQDDILKFLAHRQFPYLAEQEDDEEQEEAENLVELDIADLSLNEAQPCPHVGYNGRWNKKADTCYCWWAGGALKVCLAQLSCTCTIASP